MMDDDEWPPRAPDRPKLFNAGRIEEKVRDMNRADEAQQLALSKGIVKCALDERIREPGEEKVNPLAIVAELYPHVAKRIVEFWGTANLREYMTQLTIMDRANRAGFAEKAMEALLEIWQYVGRTSEEEQVGSHWLKDPRLLKVFKKEAIEMHKGFQLLSPLTGSEAALIDLQVMQKESRTARSDDFLGLA